MPKNLPLTRGLFSLVDDSDFAWLRQWRWMVVGPGYAGRFEKKNGKRKLIYLHRAILKAGAGQRVDHINGDRLDNRRRNLRLVTRRQNQQNRRPLEHTASGRKGVTWHKHVRKWQVRITVDGQRVHLGYYTDLDMAAQVYDAAARFFFGEYARPNFPEQETSPQIAGLLAQILAGKAARPIEPHDILQHASSCPRRDASRS